jgi:hypothetical protein
MRELGFDWRERFTITDELTGATYDWGQHNAFRLNPSCSPPTSSSCTVAAKSMNSSKDEERTS